MMWQEVGDKIGGWGQTLTNIDLMSTVNSLYTTSLIAKIVIVLDSFENTEDNTGQKKSMCQTLKQ